MNKIEQLKELGLTRCAVEIERRLNLTEKLAIAYEAFRYVTVEKLTEFNIRLKEETKVEEGKNQWGTIQSYKRTRFTALHEYSKVPPDNVLQSLQEAKALGCFDSFEIMDLESHREVPDPILFGRIIDCPDRFFIAQWDDDVKIEDILKDHQGWKFMEQSSK